MRTDDQQRYYSYNYCEGGGDEVRWKEGTGDGRGRG